jgi:hypothetical protein
LAGSSIPESVQSISTPVGVFPIYPQPNPDALQYEPSSTYYYDSTTGFYFDAKTQYYYNSKTNQWMFWCAKYSTYIPCDGGDAEMKQRLQEESRAHSNGPVYNQPTNTAGTGVTNEDPTLQTEASNTAQEETTTKEAEKGKKKKKKEEDDANKPKSAQDIQKEMVKWAKRQEKIKMTFKPTDSKDKEPSAGGSQTSAEESSRPKMPWPDNDDEEDVAPPPPDAILPGRMRGTVGVALNATSSAANASSTHGRRRVRQNYAATTTTPEPVLSTVLLHYCNTLSVMPTKPVVFHASVFMAPLQRLPFYRRWFGHFLTAPAV